MSTSRAATAEFRGSVVKQEAPRALVAVAAVVLVLSVVVALVAPQPLWMNLLNLAVVGVFLAGAWFTSREGTRAVDMPWVVALCSLVVVVAMQVEAWLDPSAVAMAFVIIGMVAFPPFVLNPLVAALAAIPMVAGFVLVAAAAFPADLLQWCSAVLGAVLVGGLLLRVRLVGIDALGALSEQSRELATRDVLTGALNRRGVEDRVAAMMASASRQEEPFFVVFIDVNGLKAANDEHGHDFGDTVIRAAAHAILGTVRASDVVGRWGGDEFVIVGVGAPLPHDVLSARLDERLRESGIPPDRWSSGLSVGCASSMPQHIDFERLVQAADRDMYARRDSVRGA